MTKNIILFYTKYSNLTVLLRVKYLKNSDLNKRKIIERKQDNKMLY